MFFQKHWTFSKIPRDVFFKTTVSFFSGFYPIFYTKKDCIKTFFLTQPFRYYFAEKQGFEPWNSYPFTAFRVRPDRPLRHFSLSRHKDNGKIG